MFGPSITFEDINDDSVGYYYAILLSQLPVSVDTDSSRQPHPHIEIKNPADAGLLSLLYPVKIFAYQQFSHLRVVCVRHSY